MIRTLIRVAVVVLAVALFTVCPGPTTRADEPKGYMVGLVTVTNTNWVAEYRRRNAELLKKYGGRILARGKPAVVLEGKAPVAHTIVVVEFPSMEKAEAWHADPDYQDLVTLRQTGSAADFFLVQGMTQ